MGSGGGGAMRGREEGRAAVGGGGEKAKWGRRLREGSEEEGRGREEGRRESKVYEMWEKEENIRREKE